MAKLDGLEVTVGCEILNAESEVEVLGTTYTISKAKAADDSLLENLDGYCDPTSKHIVIREYGADEKRSLTADDLSVDTRRVLRHELLHAYAYESGLLGYYQDETLMDWLSVQFEAMLDTFIKSGACIFPLSSRISCKPSYSENVELGHREGKKTAEDEKRSCSADGGRADYVGEQLKRKPMDPRTRIGDWYPKHPYDYPPAEKADTQGAINGRALRSVLNNMQEFEEAMARVAEIASTCGMSTLDMVNVVADGSAAYAEAVSKLVGPIKMKYEPNVAHIEGAFEPTPCTEILSNFADAYVQAMTDSGYKHEDEDQDASFTELKELAGDTFITHNHYYSGMDVAEGKDLTVVIDLIKEACVHSVGRSRELLYDVLTILEESYDVDPAASADSKSLGYLAVILYNAQKYLESAQKCTDNNTRQSKIFQANQRIQEALNVIEQQKEGEH